MRTYKENRITTLERGGSDASAIMLAKFFKAKKCIIYTDVDGVYTTDPNLTKKAKKIKVLSYEEMLEMSSLGAKVMQPASIQDAKLNKVKTVPYKHNYGYFFTSGPNTWHGMEKKEIKKERRCIQINYVTFETDWKVKS